jgi:nicotinamide-nucleotide amidase
MPKNAVILSIGDELVLGQTVDTNSAWMSKQLAAVGFSVSAHMTVADDQPAIERAIAELSTQCDLLICSGGIGPTEDDLTRQALAAVLKTPLITDDGWLTKLHEFWKKRGRTMPAINAIQAKIPEGAALLDNPVGTAAGIRAKLGKSEVFVMPGVPKEMKAMFTSFVLPQAQRLGGGAAIVSRTLHTFGLGESAVAEMLGDLMQRNRNPSVGTTVANGVVSLRVNSRFDSVAKAAAECDVTSQLCREKLGSLIYGQDEETLEQVVGRLLHRDGQSLTLATAESCTAGLLAKLITDVAGSSQWFQTGFITYSNQSKTDSLALPPALIEAHGAVSEQVAVAMATGARTRAKTDFALSITGIAGPDGGTQAKPVGTVWIGLATPQETTARHFLFPGDRAIIRDRCAKTALSLLRFHLLGERPSF